jgi:hypothetical protein
MAYCPASAALHTGCLCNRQFPFAAKPFRIVTPSATKGTTLEKDSFSDTGAVKNGELLNIKYQTFFQKSSPLIVTIYL